ncbi:VOC family protein [Massilia sp. TSP1-1-2]|uniref:VOC family protein n=1 Tax=Massilia sp. TSP1-1-2 TaxID=2804649 RepID=UPI003CE7AECE
MNAQVRAIPEDMHTLTPHLVCADALGAIDFYKRAFGATEGGVMLTPDGKLMHGMIRIGDSALMLMEENQQWGALGPTMLGGSPVTIHLYVKNCDAVYAKAVAEGATAKMVPADMFWGDRYGVLTDPFGHSWSVATHIRDVPHDEMQAAKRRRR